MREKDVRIAGYEGSVLPSSCPICGEVIKTDETFVTMYFEEARHIEYFDSHKECFAYLAKEMQKFLKEED